MEDGPAPSCTPVLTAFHQRGYVHIRGALPAAGVASFIAEVVEGLRNLGDASVALSLALDEPQTWPTGHRRRVAEVAPRDGGGGSEGDGTHWAALLSAKGGPLAAALDALLGEDAWRLPRNGELEPARCPPSSSPTPRFFYVPVALTEHDGVCEAEMRASQTGLLLSPLLQPPCSGRRVALLCGSQDEPFRLSVAAASGAETLRGNVRPWQPVNRRRYLSKGWHIDVGPGFPNDGVRSLHGDPRQGVIVLLLLTDCAAGAGGTALIPRSHDWSLRRLASACEGLTHEALNSAAVRTMRRLTEAGRVLLPCAAACADCTFDGGTSGPVAFAVEPVGVEAEEETACGVPQFVHVEQVVGRAGDVVLLHPLLLHSGTTNLALSPRVLANGVARLRDGCATRQCPILRRDIDRLKLDSDP